MALSKQRTYRCQVIGKAGKRIYTNVVSAVGPNGEELYEDEITKALRVLVPSGIRYIVTKG